MLTNLSVLYVLLCFTLEGSSNAQDASLRKVLMRNTDASALVYRLGLTCPCCGGLPSTTGRTHTPHMPYAHEEMLSLMCIHRHQAVCELRTWQNTAASASEQTACRCAVHAPTHGP